MARRFCRLEFGSTAERVVSFMQSENLSARGLMQAAETIGEDGWPPEALLFRARRNLQSSLATRV